MEMEALNNYLELVENGRALAQPPEPAPLYEPVIHLMAYAHEHGELGVECAWQLDSKVSRRLEKAHDVGPPGGWARLAGLACGCGMLRPARTAFEPNMDMAEAVSLDEADLRRLLCEAFTRKLVPPASAAGLFIMLGIHPAWGLWVAHVTHNRALARDAERAGRPGPLEYEPPPAIEPGWRDESIFEPHVAEVVNDAVFHSIAAIIATLRKLEPDARYPLDAFARLARNACHFARATAQAKLKESMTLGLAPFLPEFDQPLDQRTQDFAMLDLFDSVLIPAGVARRFDDGSFCVFAGALDHVRVADMDPQAQETKLTWLLADQAGCRVA
jgi:hypothetical protein